MWEEHIVKMSDVYEGYQEDPNYCQSRNTYPIIIIPLQLVYRT